MIFEKNGEFYFCYMPQYDGTIRESFHKLMGIFCTNGLIIRI